METISLPHQQKEKHQGKKGGNKKKGRGKFNIAIKKKTSVSSLCETVAELYFISLLA